MSTEPVDQAPPVQDKDQQYDNPPLRGSKDSYDTPDIEKGGKNTEFGFDDASIRAGFVRKVFAIVAIMCLICILMVTPVIVVTELRELMIENRWIYLPALVVFFISYCALLCCQTMARNFPMNLIMLALFTVAAGLMLMVICAVISPHIVLLAAATTTLCCVAIILFATQTKIDITSYIFVIFAATMALFIYGIGVSILSFFIYAKVLHIIFVAIACVLFMVYLALDIQMIIGGRKYEISPEDYVFAAVMLFIDIYNLFIVILSLFNSGE